MRRKIILSLTGCILIFLSSHAQSITLSECLEATRHNFPTLEQKEVTAAINKELQKAIWYAYIPQISLDGRASYQSHVTSLDINIPDINLIPGTPPIKIDGIDLPEIPKFQYNAYLQATQLIWDGGTVKALGDELAATTEAQIAEVDVEMRKVEESVIEIYFSLLMLDAQEQLQNILLEEIRRQQGRVESALANGVASENQLDELRVELLKEEQKLSQLLSSKSALINSLAIFTGMELGSDVDLLRPEPQLYPSIDPMKDTRLAPLRPEHKLLDAKATHAMAKYHSYLSEGVPKIALFARGGYGKPGLNMLNPEPSTYFVYGVQLNWNFGSLYTLSAQKKQATGTMQILELKRDALEKEIQSTLAQQSSEVDQYRDLLTQDEEIITLRERIVERAKLQEEEGRLSTIEYLQKVSEMNAAKQTRDLHELQLLKSQYKISKTLGY